MFKTVLAVVGGTVIVYKLCQGFAWYLHGKYAREFAKKEEDLRKQYGAAPVAG
jgi:hypothetical protein